MLENNLSALTDAANKVAEAINRQCDLLEKLGTPGNVIPITSAPAEQEEPATAAPPGTKVSAKSNTSKGAKAKPADTETPPAAANSNDNAEAGDPRPGAAPFVDPAEVDALRASILDAAKDWCLNEKFGDEQRAANKEKWNQIRQANGIKPSDKLPTGVENAELLTKLKADLDAAIAGGAGEEFE